MISDFRIEFSSLIARIIKAILTDIKSHYAKEGASTITQQVIKNTYLSSEKNLNRKVKEIILAIKLENSMRKSWVLILGRVLTIIIR